MVGVSEKCKPDTDWQVGLGPPMFGLACGDPIQFFLSAAHEDHATTPLGLPLRNPQVQ